MDDDNSNPIDAESHAVDRLRKDNTAENRKAFQDCHRKVAEQELNKTRRRLHQHYRKRAKQADSPQVDMENPADYLRHVLDEGPGDGG